MRINGAIKCLLMASLTLNGARNPSLLAVVTHSLVDPFGRSFECKNVKTGLVSKIDIVARYFLDRNGFGIGSGLGERSHPCVLSSDGCSWRLLAALSLRYDYRWGMNAQIWSRDQIWSDHHFSFMIATIATISWKFGCTAHRRIRIIRNVVIWDSFRTNVIDTAPEVHRRCVFRTRKLCKVCSIVDSLWRRFWAVIEIV